ncbi:MAG: S8 family serine peptidase [Candidatus Aminicenantes bacterium]|nr:S8 family serine peptidase [Candidatus Aminicenantes bacterium]
MKRESRLAIKVFVIFVLLNFSAQLSEAAPSEHPRKIVVFKKWYCQEADQDNLLRNFGAVKIKRLKLINSQAVHLSPGAEKNLKRKNEILRIDEDLIITALADKTKPKPKKPHPPPEQSEELSWGIQRIYADLVWEVTTGSMIKVAILDTGIDLDHPDLWGNIKGGINTIKPRKSADDDNGHGTHISGTVAAIDNDFGVIGVGPEIHLYAVKFLDKKGGGWLSDLIDALDWCIANKIQVINMSFGSTEGNQSFHDAIIRAYQAGITMVASAGNNGEGSGLIEYPAFYPETIAVSAVDEYDNFASFSSYGPQIDLAAPGVNILSTYKNAFYAAMEGTSMSAAHVTGTVALILTTSPKWGYDLDGDKIWDPDEIRERLMDSAENLGLHPHQQGAGLVRASCVIYRHPN